jgi:hypothetical protein
MIFQAVDEEFKVPLERYRLRGSKRLGSREESNKIRPVSDSIHTKAISKFVEKHRDVSALDQLEEVLGTNCTRKCEHKRVTRV